MEAHRDLPPEVYAAIASSKGLSYSDIGALAQLCRASRDACSCDRFWQDRLLLDMRPILDSFFDGAAVPLRPGLQAPQRLINQSTRLLQLSTNGQGGRNRTKLGPGTT